MVVVRPIMVIRSIGAIRPDRCVVPIIVAGCMPITRPMAVIVAWAIVTVALFSVMAIFSVVAALSVVLKLGAMFFIRCGVNFFTAVAVTLAPMPVCPCRRSHQGH